MSIHKFVVVVCILCGVIGIVGAQGDGYQAAAEYSAEREGDAVLVLYDGKVVFEDYQNGYTGAEPHLLVSGTKSFSCAIAVAAIEDDLLDLDEKVSATIDEWADDTPRAQVTVRQLLNLTSGIFGSQVLLEGMGKQDKNVAVLKVPLSAEPGERFQYDFGNFYVFSELMRRKLDGEDVVDYLMRRVLAPIGVEEFVILRDAAGNPNLAAGGLLTARDWANYGQLILQNGVWKNEQILDADLLRECFIGSTANPFYGLTWWLEYDLEDWVYIEELALLGSTTEQIPEAWMSGEVVPEVIVAAGSGKQRLYILPEPKMVVVRFGHADVMWDDAEFLSLVLGG